MPQVHAASPQPGAPVFIGLQLTASPETTTATAPTLAASETEEPGTFAADGVYVAHGVTLQTRLVFREGQLATIHAYATGITVAEFDAFARSVQATMGAGVSMECGSDEGPSFDEYILSGRGSRSVEWRDDSMNASVRLTPLSDERLQLSVSASWVPLLPPLDDFAGRVTPNETRAAKQDSTCEEANGGEDFEFAGVFFGASIAEAQATLSGGELQGQQRLVVPVEYGGVRGRGVLIFYEECLATVVFEADVASEANYRALVSHIDGVSGDSRLERCSSDGGLVTEEVLSGGRAVLYADWEHDTLSPQVSLSTLLPGTRRLVVEIEYEPLRHRAPNIDF